MRIEGDHSPRPTVGLGTKVIIVVGSGPQECVLVGWRGLAEAWGLPCSLWGSLGYSCGWSESAGGRPLVIWLRGAGIRGRGIGAGIRSSCLRLHFCCCKKSLLLKYFSVSGEEGLVLKVPVTAFWHPSLHCRDWEARKEPFPDALQLELR